MEKIVTNILRVNLLKAWQTAYIFSGLERGWDVAIQSQITMNLQLCLPPYQTLLAHLCFQSTILETIR